eukprot:3517034-Amphidinium_carterae.1
MRVNAMSAAREEQARNQITLEYFGTQICSARDSKAIARQEATHHVNMSGLKLGKVAHPSYHDTIRSICTHLPEEGLTHAKRNASN